jgi:hypothetical protein
MFDLELWHWEILRVPRRETRACADGGGRDQAVGLRQRDPPLGEISAPVSGTCSLRSPEGSEMQAAQQAHGGVTLVLAYAAHHLLDVHRADPRDIPGLVKAAESLGGIPPAQGIHKDGGVKQKGQYLVIRPNSRRLDG